MSQGPENNVQKYRDLARNSFKGAALAGAKGVFYGACAYASYKYGAYEAAKLLGDSTYMVGTMPLMLGIPALMAASELHDVRSNIIGGVKALWSSRKAGQELVPPPIS